jgi:hypothetical protein
VVVAASQTTVIVIASLVGVIVGIIATVIVYKISNNWCYKNVRGKVHDDVAFISLDEKHPDQKESTKNSVYTIN